MPRDQGRTGETGVTGCEALTKIWVWRWVFLGRCANPYLAREFMEGARPKDSPGGAFEGRRGSSGKTVIRQRYILF